MTIASGPAQTEEYIGRQPLFARGVVLRNGALAPTDLELRLRWALVAVGPARAISLPRPDRGHAGRCPPCRPSRFRRRRKYLRVQRQGAPEGRALAGFRTECHRYGFLALRGKGAGLLSSVR